MQPTKINVMGDDFLLFSLAHGREAPCKAISCGAKAAVLLMPGIEEDFSITAYSDGGKPMCEYYAAAICAAAFLKQKRGLPLSEFTFETPGGIVEVFSTGADKYTIAVQKCKQLYIKSIDLLGCDFEYSDIRVNEQLFRTVSATDIKLFDRRILPKLVAVGASMPCSIVLSSSSKGKLMTDYYTDFSSVKPTRLLINAAAAYKEYLSGHSADADFLLEDGASACRVQYSTVTLTARPVLY